MSDKKDAMVLRRNLREPVSPPAPAAMPEAETQGDDVAWAPTEAIVAHGTLSRSRETERGQTLELYLYDPSRIKLTFLASRTGLVTGFVVRGDGRIELVYAT